MKLLLVEDDTDLGTSLHGVLVASQFHVVWVRSCEAARNFIRSEPFDVLLFDIVLPGESGLDLLRWCRQTSINTPVMMLTARDAITDRVIGLDQGADDYLGKPFAMEEFLSRVRALGRRFAAQKSPLWRFGELTIDTHNRSVLLDNEHVRLSKREYEILIRLATAQGKVLTRSQLQRGSDAEFTEESNAVDVHVHSLRRKLGNARISTVRGIGYVFES